MLGLEALDYCYPTSFVSNNDKISERLRLLSNDILLSSVCRFRVSVPSNHRTRLGLTKLIMEDFEQQVNNLVQLSNERLYEIVSPPPHCLRFQLPLACQFVHNRYGTNIAPHLLRDQTRLNPPEATIDDTGATSTANWLQIPVDQLKSRLSKVDLGIVKACCDLYLSPESPPKSKTARYTVIAGRAEGKHRPAIGRCFCRGQEADLDWAGRARLGNGHAEGKHRPATGRCFC
jgi:hypothetical protein